MRPYRTSLTDIHSYSTTVHMSILSQPIMRGVQIMPSSRAARSTGSQCHHAHSIDPCRAHAVGNGKASNHADTMHTTRMQAAGSWAARATTHEQPIRRHVSTSSFQLGNTRYAADHAHLSQPTDAWRRGKALTTMLLAVKLMKPAFASKPAECLIRVRW